MCEAVGALCQLVPSHARAHGVGELRRRGGRPRGPGPGKLVGVLVANEAGELLCGLALHVARRGTLHAALCQVRLKVLVRHAVPRVRHERHLLREPDVQGGGTHFGDVDPQPSVDAGAAHAYEHPAVDRGPRGVGRAAVGALAVLRPLDQLHERAPVLGSLLLADALGLARLARQGGGGGVGLSRGGAPLRSAIPAPGGSRSVCRRHRPVLLALHGAQFLQPRWVREQRLHRLGLVAHVDALVLERRLVDELEAALPVNLPHQPLRALQRNLAAALGQELNHCEGLVDVPPAVGGGIKSLAQRLENHAAVFIVVGELRQLRQQRAVRAPRLVPRGKAGHALQVGVRDEAALCERGYIVAQP
mmetsp:Transcript_30336/g.58307  ORF Transcript_30336/g.58307 Transcript_30336/m.58307 type:complete len:361 (+) Transcript_30336:1484-2566(+)